MRLSRIRQELLKLALDYSEIKEPPSRAINLIRTLRDHKWKMIPANLLVTGDIVQLSLDDESNIIFRKRIAHNVSEELYEICDPPPIKRQLSHIQQRREGAFDTIFTMYSIFTTLCALACIYSWFGMVGTILCRLLTVALISIFALLSPIWSMFFGWYDNARLICLTESLQGSKTPYAESDVDEFDEEAPPPTKDIYVNPADILHKIWQALTDYTPGFLFWSHSLEKSFATASVVSFLDREGPISSSYPMPLEVVFPSPLVDNEIAFGEFIIDSKVPSITKTNYADEAVKDEDLKALALSIMASSLCGVGRGQFPRELHSRFPANIHPERRLDPVFRTCACAISRELGFHASAVASFKSVLDFWIIRDVGISTTLNPVEYQGLFSRILCDRRDGKLQMFSFGDLTTVACLSSYQWNSKKIISLPDSLKNKLIELDDNLAASDLQCIGISYKPILMELNKIQFEDRNVISFAKATDPNFEKTTGRVARDQIFLGALISGYEPKDDMQELIDDLENCGIRFVYFSPYSESITKAYGSRLGLETDWNSCIILSTPKAEQYLDTPSYTDPKSKLPRGVYNIRPHLHNVDDIPLHVSLFAESEPRSVAEMHRIYRENGEVVICIGSSLNWTNMEVMSTAELSICMEPSHTKSIAMGRISSMELASAITSLTSPITLPFDCSPYVLTEIIREARCHYRGRLACEASNKALGVSLLISALFAVKSSIPLFVCGLISIFHGLTFLAAPYEPDIMKLMPDRHVVGEHNRPLSTNLLARSCLNGVIIGWTCRMVQPQYSIVSISIVFICLCMTFLHVHRSVLNFGPFEHRLWSFSMLLVMGAMIIITMIYDNIGYFLLLVDIVKALCIALIGIAGNEAIKYRYHLEFQKLEKRAKLQFNTKLGMHSPV